MNQPQAHELRGLWKNSSSRVISNKSRIRDDIDTPAPTVHVHKKEKLIKLHQQFRLLNKATGTHLLLRDGGFCAADVSHFSFHHPLIFNDFIKRTCSVLVERHSFIYMKILVSTFEKRFLMKKMGNTITF